MLGTSHPLMTKGSFAVPEPLFTPRSSVNSASLEMTMSPRADDLVARPGRSSTRARCRGRNDQGRQKDNGQHRMDTTNRSSPHGSSQSRDTAGPDPRPRDGFYEWGTHPCHAGNRTEHGADDYLGVVIVTSHKPQTAHEA